jgi:lactate dehydrogenase-like 2-hydroxyacid dehydrogenase
MKIAFTTDLPAEGFKRLARHELNACMSDADVLVSTFDFRVTRQMIESMPSLRLIANFGAGYNNIALDACRERGIRVTNTPQPVIEPTAELAFALMIDIARRVSEFDRAIRSHTGQPLAVMNNLSHSLYGKTLGIIGMGHIGQALARRAIAAGMKIIYHNRHKLNEDIESRYCARYVDFQTLLQDSDFVSLNLPYTQDVHHLIGKPELGMMKRTAYLINTARGAHVHERALLEALQNGIIAGAALDVYEFEPQITEDLMALPNIVLSPHTGTGTWEGRIDMCENVCDNILAFEAGEYNKMNIVL